MNKLFQNFFLKFKKQINPKKPKTYYKKIDHHIYHNGKTFRVRIAKNKKTYSKNFTDEKFAINFRNSLLYQLKNK